MKSEAPAPTDRSESEVDFDAYVARVRIAIHECNNALMGIYGNSEYLKDCVDADDPRREVIDEIFQLADDAIEAIKKIPSKKSS